MMILFDNKHAMMAAFFWKSQNCRSRERIEKGREGWITCEIPAAARWKIPRKEGWD